MHCIVRTRRRDNDSLTYINKKERFLYEQITREYLVYPPFFDSNMHDKFVFTHLNSKTTSYLNIAHRLRVVFNFTYSQTGYPKYV